VESVANILSVSYPALTELSVSIAQHIDVTEHTAFQFPILQGTRWPRLKKLSIGCGLSLYPPPYGFDSLNPPNIHEKARLMASFLERHPTLECLRFRGYDSFFPYAGCIPPNSLPILRSISVSYFMSVISMASFLPIEVGVHLHYFQGLVTRECLSLLAQLTNLRRCEVSVPPDIVEDFFQSIPFLKRLSLNCTRSQRQRCSYTAIVSSLAPTAATSLTLFLA